MRVPWRAFTPSLAYLYVSHLGGHCQREGLVPDVAVVVVENDVEGDVWNRIG